MTRKYMVFGKKKFSASKCSSCGKNTIGFYHGCRYCSNCISLWKNGNKIKGLPLVTEKRGRKPYKNNIDLKGGNIK